MKLLLVVALLGIAHAMPHQTWSMDWEEWKQQHGKTYVEDEEPKRQMIWQENLHNVLKHNYEYDLGMHTYKMGMNSFADMTVDEFRGLYLSEFQANPMDICQKNYSLYKTDDMPDTVDWSKKGYVTPVKNQKQCGSCWAFSTTGSLEGQHFKKTGELVSLSEQNLVDCSTMDGNHGCGGGLMDNGFKYIRDNGGIDTEKSYPYTAMNGKCHFSRSKVGATLKGCVDLPHEDEMALKMAVASVGPISVAIDAGHQSFQLYESGVYYEPECSETRLDHGVLAVGYGTENGKDYWLVKNSWGETWGKEGGYIRMSRNKHNNCGIATQASFPLV